MLSRRIVLPLVDFVFLVLAMVLLLVNPPQKADASPPLADFTLVVRWDHNTSTDLDIYVRNPERKTAWFQSKDIGDLHIDRDDLGRTNDIGPLNEEIVLFRAPQDGSYFVSVHTYRNNDVADQTVAMELRSRDGRAVWGEVFPLPPQYEERPVVELQFRNGKLVGHEPSDIKLRRAK